MSEQSPLNTGVTVAIVIISVIFAAVCTLWIIRRSRYVCNRRSMLHRSNSIRLPNQADSAVWALNDSCRNCSASLPTRRLEQTIFPASPPHTNSVSSHHMANLTDMPGTGTPLQSRAHPLHRPCTMDNDRFTAGICGNSDPRINKLQPSEASSESVVTRELQPAVLSKTTPQTKREPEAPSMVPLGERVVPGLKACKLQVNTDAPTASYIDNLAKRIILDFEGSDSGMSVMEGNSDSMDTLPAFLVHSPDANLSSSTVCEFAVAKLSSTPSPLEDGQTVKMGTMSAIHQVATPPPTPTNGPTFSATAPIPPFNSVVGDSRDKELNEDIKTWSDVLSFSEYEREDHLIHARRKVFSFRNHLPSPPPTPTLFFTPPSPPSLAPGAVIQEAQWLNPRSTSYLALKHTDKNNDTNAWSTAHPHQRRRSDYSHAHETSGTPPYYPGLPIDIEVGDGDKSNSKDDLPPYQGFGFDYEARLVLKRATSLAKPVKPEVSNTRIVLKQVASVIRPRPPLSKYKPLLLRQIDRSKIKTRTGFLGVEVSPITAVKKSTIPTTHRQRKGSRAREELPPHVQVLELLIEHAREHRTGDIALGTV